MVSVNERRIQLSEEEKEYRKKRDEKKDDQFEKLLKVLAGAGKNK